jgi:hypothetical protein
VALTKSVQELTLRLSIYEALLERLAQGLEDVAAELRQLIQEEHAVVRQRHFPRRLHLAAADQADIGDGLVRSATRAGGDQRRAGAGAAGDSVVIRAGLA